MLVCVTKCFNFKVIFLMISLLYVSHVAVVVAAAAADSVNIINQVFRLDVRFSSIFLSLFFNSQTECKIFGFFFVCWHEI